VKLLLFAAVAGTLLAQSAGYTCWNSSGKGPRCPAYWPSDDGDPACFVLIREGQNKGKLFVRKHCRIADTEITSIETIQ
jgi:hypothetical protein